MKPQKETGEWQDAGWSGEDLEHRYVLSARIGYRDGWDDGRSDSTLQRDIRIHSLLWQWAWVPVQRRLYVLGYENGRMSAQESGSA